MERICSKLTDYVGVSQEAGGSNATQRDRGKLEKGSDRNLVRITSANAESCIWEGIIPRISAGQGLTTEEQLCREGPATDKQLNTSQQHDLWQRRPSVYWAELTTA